MGLSTFPSPAEGLLHVLVMNTVISVALLKNMVRSVLQVVGGIGIGIGSPSPNLDREEQSSTEGYPTLMSETVVSGRRRARRVSITRFRSLCKKRPCLSSSNCCCNGNINGSPGSNSTECCCCVCLCKFEADEEVSELPCEHFFHKGCLDKWFDNQHATCPLCRSIF